MNLNHIPKNGDMPLRLKCTRKVVSLKMTDDSLSSIKL